MHQIKQNLNFHTSTYNICILQEEAEAERNGTAAARGGTPGGGIDSCQNKSVRDTAYSTIAHAHTLQLHHVMEDLSLMV